MMAQYDRSTAFFAGDPVKMPTAQPAAKGAKRSPGGYFVHHDGIGVLVFYPVLDAHFFKERGQHRRGEIGLPLIQIAGQNFNGQQPAPLQLVKNRKQRVTVFATRHANQPLPAGFDHAVLINRLARVAHKTLAQFAKFGALRGTVKQGVNIVRLIQHDFGLDQLRRPIKRRMKQIGSGMRYILVMLAVVVGLAGCTGKPNADDPLLSDRVLRIEDYFDGHVVATGQFQDTFGTVRRRFVVDINGTWDGQTLTMVEDFVYEDNSTEQRVWKMTKTGPETWSGKADGVIGTATGVARGDTFNWTYKIDLPVPDGTLRVSFNDWFWKLSDTRVYNRAYMKKYGVDIGEVQITFDKKS